MYKLWLVRHYKKLQNRIIKKVTPEMLPEHVHGVQVVSCLEGHEALLLLVLDVVRTSGVDTDKDEIVLACFTCLTCLLLL